MREVDGQLGGEGELRVPGHLGALVPCEGAAQMRGQIVDPVDESVGDAVGVFSVG
ncbi:hypothetical protein ACH61_03245 [Rathayibacter tanaceti]|uniref:Uncharacterized protein n=1 Tax=Rathayibacter tanaceti TaxID=1671680 RepID=A0A162FUF2_9MICO|nr:hypothetical protein ACH61_03245 [Rathayibacter tanaceti]